MITIKNLTNLYTLAADESLTQPTEIHLAHDSNAAIAVYDGEPDVEYACLDDLLGEHTIDADLHRGEPGGGSKPGFATAPPMGEQRRDGRVVSKREPFTADEIATVKTQLEAGERAATVARMLGRSAKSVRKHAERLGIQLHIGRRPSPPAERRNPRYFRCTDDQYAALNRHLAAANVASIGDLAIGVARGELAVLPTKAEGGV